MHRRKINLDMLRQTNKYTAWEIPDPNDFLWRDKKRMQNTYTSIYLESNCVDSSDTLRVIYLRRRPAASWKKRKPVRKMSQVEFSTSLSIRKKTSTAFLPFNPSCVPWLSNVFILWYQMRYKEKNRLLITQVPLRLLKFLLEYEITVK